MVAEVIPTTLFGHVQSKNIWPQLLHILSYFLHFGHAYGALPGNAVTLWQIFEDCTKHLVIYNTVYMIEPEFLNSPLSVSNL